MNIEIREARAEDVETAIPLIYSSGPACFDYVFSHRTRIDALEYLRRTFVRESGEFGYRNHLVATLDGEVVGTGAAFSGRDMLGFTVVALRSILGCYGAFQGMGVIRRGLQVESIVRPPSGNIHYIAHLGVSPEVRSHGVGSRMVARLLESGRGLGRTTAGLDVSAENPRAEALYERIGFKVTGERESGFKNETATVPTHRRMEMAL